MANRQTDITLENINTFKYVFLQGRKRYLSWNL